MLSLQWFCKTAVLDSTFLKLKVLYLSVFCRRAPRKICWMSQQGTGKSIFRVIFQISFDVITTMILQNTHSRFNFFWIESFSSWVCYLGDPQKYMLNVAARSREEHLLIGFDVITTMILKNTSSSFNFFQIESFDTWVCYQGEPQICWMSQQGTENSVFTLILWICFDFITIMILQNTNTKFNLLWIKSVYSWVYYPGEHKKICWVSQQEPEKSIFKLDLMLLLQWFCKTPLPDSTYFEFKTLIPWCATLDSHEKKNVDCRSKDRRRAF